MRFMIQPLAQTAIKQLFPLPSLAPPSATPQGVLPFKKPLASQRFGMTSDTFHTTAEALRWNRLDGEPTLHNDHGYVATTYERIQNIDGLRKAIAARPVSPATYASNAVAVFQGAEASLINMAALFTRAADALKTNQADQAAEYLLMAQGFNRTMVLLSRVPGQLDYGSALRQTPPGNASAKTSVLSLPTSKQYKHYLHAKKDLDRAAIAFFKRRSLTGQETPVGRQGSLPEALANASLGTPEGLIHQVLGQFDQEALVWYNNLEAVRIPHGVRSYQQAVRPDLIKAVIENPEYAPTTLINEFRSAHIIPELFSAEVNAHLHQATMLIKGYTALKDRPDQHPQRLALLQAGIGHLSHANTLFPAIATPLDALADGLSYAQYKQFRDNFGVTSASESFAIAKLLAKRLPSRLGKALIQAQTGLDIPDDRPLGPELSGQVADAIAKAPAQPTPIETWLVGQLSRESSKFYHQLLGWYDSHLKLPVLQVGASPSLAGANDAIVANHRLRAAVAKNATLRFLTGDPTPPVGQRAPEDEARHSLRRWMVDQASFHFQRLQAIASVNKAVQTHLSGDNADVTELRRLHTEARKGEDDVHRQQWDAMLAQEAAFLSALVQPSP